jgi:glycosyltransferase involved in cell wall biosynthesis
MKHPKISVLTPSYNSAPYLKRAIESVLEQDYKNWEHIIMDGGSKDGTVEILQSYPHLIWKSEKDKGQSNAMNKAFKESTGDIIVYLNADDWFEPNIFSKVIDAFNKEEFDILVGNGKFVEDDKVIYEWNSETSYRKCLLHFKYTFPLNAVSYFYKRQVQEIVGGFNESNHYTMDYEFLLHVLKKFKAKKLNIPFGNFHFDGQNKTASIDAVKHCSETAIRFCKKHDLLGLLYYKMVKYNLPVRIRMRLKKIFGK